MNVQIAKKFEKSVYNIEIKSLENGDILMFNTLTASLGILGETGRLVYNNIESIDLDEIKDPDRLNVIKNLVSNGFLVEQGLDEYKYYENIFLKSKFSNNSLNLTIAVTLDCNMSCPYCFEKRENSFMNKETADGLIKFIKNYINSTGTKELYINWFGGEPLLNLDIIVYISDILVEYCSKNNIVYMAGITTNGVLLNKENASILKKYNVNKAEITIDGMKEIHNKRRILNNKQGSFDIIFNNIMECNDILPIVVRSNIDKDNLDSIYELINELYKNNLRFYYRPVVNNDGPSKFSEKYFTQEQFSKINIDLAKYIHENCGEYISIIYPRLQTGSCNGNKENHFTIDPNGLLHKCNAFLSDPDKAVGNIFDGITSHTRNINWIGLEIQSKCKGCKKLPICGTPCPLERIKNPNFDLECPYEALDLDERLNLFLSYK